MPVKGRAFMAIWHDIEASGEAEYRTGIRASTCRSGSVFPAFSRRPPWRRLGPVPSAMVHAIRNAYS